MYVTKITNLSEPIAAASIAQVHFANIVHSGEVKEVAIKVLRPDIEKLLNDEIDALMLLAYIIQSFVKKTKRLKLIEIMRGRRAEAVWPGATGYRVPGGRPVSYSQTTHTYLPRARTHWEGVMRLHLPENGVMANHLPRKGVMPKRLAPRHVETTNPPRRCRAWRSKRTQKCTRAS